MLTIQRVARNEQFVTLEGLFMFFGDEIVSGDFKINQATKNLQSFCEAGQVTGFLAGIMNGGFIREGEGREPFPSSAGVCDEDLLLHIQYARSKEEWRQSTKVVAVFQMLLNPSDCADLWILAPRP